MSDCPLTPRQLQLLALVARGLHLKEIAHLSGRTEQAEKNLMYSIHQRLDTQSQAHAVYTALKNGWLK